MYSSSLVCYPYNVVTCYTSQRTWYRICNTRKDFVFYGNSFFMFFFWTFLLITFFDQGIHCRSACQCRGNITTHLFGSVVFPQVVISIILRAKEFQNVPNILFFFSEKKVKCSVCKLFFQIWFWLVWLNTTHHD